MVGLLLAIIYLAFISLGLPDALLGTAWTSIYVQFDVPVSYAGIVSMIIALGTIISSLLSDRISKKIGTGLLTSISVLMTAGALFGFSFCSKFWMLCIMAIPYGLGAGGVDASLNNYVALHYASRHMSWLHCMWGIGASVGPYIMGYALTGNGDWHNGYLYVGIIQLVLTVILFSSLPLWNKKKKDASITENNVDVIQEKKAPLGLKRVLLLRGAIPIMLTFFCYCSLEATCFLWTSSYLNIHNGMSVDDAAKFTSLFYLGMTVGRFVNGFLTIKFSDKTMIRVGQYLIAIGIILLFMPYGGNIITLIGIAMTGLGCAPIYPCIIHNTPKVFGEDNSQAVIGIEMASAYLGTCLMPSCFGLIARNISVKWFPAYLLVFLLLMILCHELLYKVIKKEKNEVKENN